MTANNTLEILTARQVAKRGILPERAIRRLIAEGKIPVIKVGRTQYVNFSQMCADLQSGTGTIWSE
ncbi:MAG: hypothetical protein FWB80_07560 [Defluviitaleaceae bacterium]|nr:hypothetical protein [Defluviitaleaceae bacterium]